MMPEAAVPEYSDETNPLKVRLFLKNLCFAKEKLEERKEAKHNFKKQIEKVKKISGQKTNKKVFNQELQALEQRMSNLIEAEKKIMTRQQQEYTFSSFLEGRIAAMEKKIDEFLKYKEERRKKVEELEHKIKNKTITRTERIFLVKQQINNLEKKLENLKKSKKYSEEDLKKIEERIKFLKQKL